MSATRLWELEPYFDVDGGRAVALEDGQKIGVEEGIAGPADTGPDVARDGLGFGMCTNRDAGHRCALSKSDPWRTADRRFGSPGNRYNRATPSPEST